MKKIEFKKPEKENEKEERAEKEKEIKKQEVMGKEKEPEKEESAEQKKETQKEKKPEERKQTGEKTRKKTGLGQGWFLVGSFRRLCMVIVSYVLTLVFLGSFFVIAAYSHWFGAETAHTYEETERFRQQMQSKMEKAAPAWKHYFQQEIAQDREMVKIYTLRQEKSETGEMENRWREVKTYTCESGADIAGFRTDLEDCELDEFYYLKKEDRFVFQEPHTHFVERWESRYNQRSGDGVQMYFAVSGETMKEWMLEAGKINGITEYLDVPDDAYYVKCDYSLYDKAETFLCYSESKDRWYYLEQDEYGQVRKQAFRIPDMVYFPLYGVEQSSTKDAKAAGKKEFSDGFSASCAYLNNGIVYNKTLDLPASNGEILKTMPFFNLRTVLYEAGKEYYHQKALLRYIDNKMGGYLWKFTFTCRSDSSDIEDIEIGTTGVLSEENDGNRKVRVVYNSSEALPETAAVLEGIGKERGYDSVTAELALPEYSLGTIVLGTEDRTVQQSIRYELECRVFYGYHDGIWIGLAVCSVLCWIYIMVNLLFAGGKKVKISGGSGGEAEISLKKEVILSGFDQLFTEGSFLILAMSVCLPWLCYSLAVDKCYFWNESIWVLIIFFVVTATYFFCYAGLASLIRRIRTGVLWKNSLILKVLKWCWKKARNIWGKWCGFFQEVWMGLHSKRKMLLLLGGYILASAVCGVATIVFFIGSIYGDGFFLFIGIFTLVLFFLLQGKAVHYMLGNEAGKERILNGIRELSDGNLEYEVDTQGLSGEYLEMAQMLPKLRDGLDKAIQKSLRDERMKTELITNVSHDIKTPLTSIINYVDLLKRAKPQGENVGHYLDVLTQKSERLRHLIEDLVEASKASSGTLPLEKTNLDLTELIQQTAGEFEEKLLQKNLQMMIHSPNPPVTVFADGRRMFRILENLFQNVYKYAMEGTRVYLDLEVVSPGSCLDSAREKSTENPRITGKDGNAKEDGEAAPKDEGHRLAVLTLRNISAAPLNISEEELTERFVRGEESRTTEGSGLGLSIAKDLVRLQGGEFRLKIDGDLFKVVLEFPIVEGKSEK